MRTGTHESVFKNLLFCVSNIPPALHSFQKVLSCFSQTWGSSVASLCVPASHTYGLPLCSSGRLPSCPTLGGGGGDGLHVAIPQSIV